jgi:Protein of unknown function (DUF3379)
VNCEQARLLIGAEPRSGAAELAAHLAACPACAQLRDEMLAFETRIEQALQQPPDLARVRPQRQAPKWREWALAASVLLGMAALLGVWLLRPSDTLAHDIVAHVQHEPDSWLSAQQVNAQGIGDALHGAGVALDLTSDKITYAQSCWFHGHYVPHLVVQTAQGPATVLILRHEQVPGARNFHEAGLNGVIVPAAAGRGSIAVLAHGGGVEAVARQMQQDVRWLPEPP